MKNIIIAFALAITTSLAHAADINVSSVTCQTSTDGQYVFISGIVKNTAKKSILNVKLLPSLLDKFDQRIGTVAEATKIQTLNPGIAYKFTLKVKMTVNEYDGCSATIEPIYPNQFVKPGAGQQRL